MPLVSVIIPTKNRREFLLETIESLREQIFPDWEAVVVDDESSDGTWSVLREAAAHDPRIRPFVRRSETPGASVCRNEGVARSTGDFVIFLDSDDLLTPFCLEQRVRIMEGNPDLDFAVFPCMVFERLPGDRPLLHNRLRKPEHDVDRYLALDIPWHTMGPIWRRTAVLSIGPWVEWLPSWQDWEFHLRAILGGSSSSTLTS